MANAAALTNAMSKVREFIASDGDSGWDLAWFVITLRTSRFYSDNRIHDKEGQRNSVGCGARSASFGRFNQVGRIAASQDWTRSCTRLREGKLFCFLDGSIRSNMLSQGYDAIFIASTLGLDTLAADISETAVSAANESVLSFPTYLEGRHSFYRAFSGY